MDSVYIGIGSPTTCIAFLQIMWNPNDYMHSVLQTNTLKVLVAATCVWYPLNTWLRAFNKRISCKYMCVWLCHVRGCGVVHILLTSSPPLKCSHPCSTTSSPSSSRKHENLPLPCSTCIWEKGVSWRGRGKEGGRGKKESQMINGSTF